jgi:SAM-dependent methyltransferase
MDVVDLRHFYGGGLGKVARRLVGRTIKTCWQDTAGMRVLGIGYAPPYLGLFREDAERCLAFMPAAQGAIKWPSERPALAALVDEWDFPLNDGAVDRVLLVHSLEVSRDVSALLRETWRVLAPGGRLLCVIPNRRGLWARMDTTPFGQGRPYSRLQIMHLLRETLYPAARAPLAVALVCRVGAHGRGAVGAVRRRACRRSNEAGLSRASRAPQTAAPRAGDAAGAGADAARLISNITQQKGRVRTRP